MGKIIMSETIITIEIAKQVKLAIQGVVDSKVNVVADGVADQPSPDGDKIKLPCVSIVVNECIPMQYKSAVKTFPVEIEAVSWYPDDRDQVQLYTMANQISIWLSNPSLTLTLAAFDALVIEGEPERGIDAERLQYFRWRMMCHVNGYGGC
jgi:hypothetical protein